MFSNIISYGRGLISRTNGNRTEENKTPNENNKVSSTAKKGKKVSDEINPLSTSASLKNLNSLNASNELPVNPVVNSFSKERLFPGNSGNELEGDEPVGDEENNREINDPLILPNDQDDDLVEFFELEDNPDLIEEFNRSTNEQNNELAQNHVIQEQVPNQVMADPQVIQEHPADQVIAEPPPVNILQPLTPAAIVAIQNHFSTIDRDDTKVPPQQRLVNMMDYIKNTYAIDPKNFKIDFKLNGAPKRTKVEPYYIGSEIFFKTGFTAAITSQDAEGNAFADLTGKPLKIEFKREIFSLMKNPTMIAEYANAYGNGFVDIALAKINEEHKGSLNFEGLTQDERNAVIDSALKQSSFAIGLKKDANGKTITDAAGRSILESLKAEDSVTKAEISLKLLPSESNKKYYQYQSGIGADVDALPEEGFLKHIKYEINFSHPTEKLAFIQSPHFSIHLKTIEDRIKKLKEQFINIQNKYGSYTEKKLWGKGGVEETEDFKHLVADLSLDEEKAIQKNPEHLSPNTKKYLEKKKEYLNLNNHLEKMRLDKKILSAEEHTRKVSELVSKLKSGGDLSQEERDLMRSIRSNNSDLIAAIGPEHSSDVNVAESYLKTRTGDRLVELKESLKALAKNINQENQKLLGHFYQLKETAFELKAYKAELEVLKKEFKESDQTINTLISDLDKNLKNYDSFVKSIENRLKSTPGSHSRNLNKVANHPDNILFSTSIRQLGKDGLNDLVEFGA